MQLGRIAYEEAWDLQRSLAGAVSQGAIPDTVLLLEHEPVVTLGRTADGEAELHLPDGVEVDVVLTDRGGKSTFHGPGQLVCYPILDLNRHGRDVKEYVRRLERSIIATLAPLGVQAKAIDGLTGVWVDGPAAAQAPDAPAPGPRKIASIGVHITRWVTTHGYALNVDLDPAPFSQWITACGLEGAAFTTVSRELGRPVHLDEVRPLAVAALAHEFELELAELAVEDGAGLWPQPRHTAIAANPGRGPSGPRTDLPQRDLGAPDDEWAA